MNAFRLAQFVSPGMRYLDFIGKRESITAGWSIVKRRPVRRTLNPLAAPEFPSLSPDAGKDGAVGGLSSLHGVSA